MYSISIYDKTTGYCLELTLLSSTEMLDFISLLSLSRNKHLEVSVSYERREDTKYDEIKSHG